MPQIDDITRLHHIMDAAQEAVQFAKGRKCAGPANTRLLSLALVQLLQIIGEAAGGTSEDLRNRYSDIAWREMAAMRNRLIHGYFDIDFDLVWDTITEELPPLISLIQKALAIEEQKI